MNSAEIHQSFPNIITRLKWYLFNEFQSFEGMGIKKDWLSLGFGVDLGDGEKVKFWTDVWVEGYALSNKFSRLFLLATDQNCSVKDMGSWSKDCWQWKFSWKRPLRSWEEDVERELVKMLKLRAPSQNKEDRWQWHLETLGTYTTKSAYSWILKGEPKPATDFIRVWKASIPPKVSAFCWQLLHKKLPTKDNLSIRGICNANSNLNCCWCDSSIETPNHIFAQCNVAFRLWMKCYKWWGVQYVLDNSCSMLFEQHKWLGGPKLLDRGWNIIWFAVLWTLWLGRNEKIFQMKETKLDRFFELVQIRSFFWVTNIQGMEGFSLSDWCENPTKCLKNNPVRKDSA
ncbi:hypothetical protein SLEP1_g36700 [Rubroshorea leprosula]|uniref:Reverse transcriptase zinc-binding domain-containing protein n=1 Tax=Rubroshorea leprosula TaxID=152421 RepID=A0AAV5KSU0_9ROSI|nr:hypothetical protein SLEP1_g36700 [Rubroshorea leprosula]